MKIKLFIAFLATFLVLVPAQGQDKEKKRNKHQPELRVVQLAETPPPAPAAVQTPAANGSLFSDAGAGTSLVVDFKARQLGDLVFVDIVENSEATVESGAKRGRSSGDAAGIGTIAGALPIGGAAAVSNVIGALGRRSYNGNGTTQRNSEVRARITARVVEVLPNGDLRIEALKLVRINKETEQVAVTGIIRPSDLGADNSIPTVSIGDLRVEFNGQGVASRDNAPGWLFRLFDRISPF